MKTVCPKGRVGSNPTLSALEKYPSWPKGLPWKGSRSLIAARGFKSLLLRSAKAVSESSEKTEKNILTDADFGDKIQKLSQDREP